MIKRLGIFCGTYFIIYYYFWPFHLPTLHVINEAEVTGFLGTFFFCLIVINFHILLQRAFPVILSLISLCVSWAHECLVHFYFLKKLSIKIGCAIWFVRPSPSPISQLSHLWFQLIELEFRSTLVSSHRFGSVHVCKSIYGFYLDTLKILNGHTVNV